MCTEGQGGVGLLSSTVCFGSSVNAGQRSEEVQWLDPGVDVLKLRYFYRWQFGQLCPKPPAALKLIYVPHLLIQSSKWI